MVDEEGRNSCYVLNANVKMIELHDELLAMGSSKPYGRALDTDVSGSSWVLVQARSRASQGQERAGLPRTAPAFFDVTMLAQTGPNARIKPHRETASA